MQVLADSSEVLAAAAVANVTMPIADNAGLGAVRIVEDGTAPNTPFESEESQRKPGNEYFTS